MRSFFWQVDETPTHPDGRLENVKFWLNRFTEWDLDKARGKFGATVMSCAVMMGPNRFELVKYLISRGATVDGISFNSVVWHGAEDLSYFVFRIL